MIDTVKVDKIAEQVKEMAENSLRPLDKSRYQEGFCNGYRKALADHGLVPLDEPQFMADHRAMTEAWYSEWRRKQQERLDQLVASRSAITQDKRDDV